MDVEKLIDLRPVCLCHLNFWEIINLNKLEHICKQIKVDTIREATIDLKTNSACNVQNKSTKKSYDIQCKPEASHLGDMLLCKLSKASKPGPLDDQERLVGTLVNSRYLPGITSVFSHNDCHDTLYSYLLRDGEFHSILLSFSSLMPQE